MKKVAQVTLQSCQNGSTINLRWLRVECAHVEFLSFDNKDDGPKEPIVEESFWYFVDGNSNLVHHFLCIIVLPNLFPDSFGEMKIFVMAMKLMLKLKFSCVFSCLFGKTTVIFILTDDNLSPTCPPFRECIISTKSCI